MANICTSTIRFYGEREDIVRLVTDIKDVCTNADGNILADVWIGELLRKMGQDNVDDIKQSEMDLRGSISSCSNFEWMLMEESAVQFEMYIDSKWVPPVDWMYAVAEHYNLGMAFLAEEYGCEIYCTNDFDVFHDYTYSVYNHESGEQMYFATLDEAKEYIADNNLTKENYSMYELEEWC